MTLQRCNIHISHCPDGQMKNADTLSRMIPEKTTCELIYINIAFGIINL